jgi:hypothetical protein
MLQPASAGRISGIAPAIMVKSSGWRWRWKPWKSGRTEGADLMFGIDNTVLAFILLAGLSAGAVAYAFLVKSIENDKKTGKRLEAIK